MRRRVRIGRNLGSPPRVPGAPAAHAMTVEIIVEIPEGTDGRLSELSRLLTARPVVDFLGDCGVLVANQNLCRGVEPIDVANRLIERKTND